MDTKMTYYEVLQPTGIPNLYVVMEEFAYETEEYGTKTPEFIKQLLVESGEYASNIIVRYKQK